VSALWCDLREVPVTGTRESCCIADKSPGHTQTPYKAYGIGKARRRLRPHIRLAVAASLLAIETLKSIRLYCIDMQQKSKRAEIRSRIAEINEQIDDERQFRQYAAHADYQFRMSDARTRALKQERDELREILGDL
jgi:hypothetical protein